VRNLLVAIKADSTLEEPSLIAASVHVWV